MGRTRTIVKVEHVEKKWLSKEEAKKYLGCGDDFLQKLRDSGLVSFARFGSKMYWYELGSLDRFIARNKVV